MIKSRFRPEINELAFWVELLKRPQRWFLGWFGGPKLTSRLTSFFSAGLNSAVSLEGASHRGTLQDSRPASLDDLRIATMNDVVWVQLTHVRSARAQSFCAEKHPYVCFLDHGFEAMKTFFDLDQPQGPEEYFSLAKPETSEIILNATPSRVWPWSPKLVPLPEPPGFPYWRAGPKSDNHLVSEAYRLNRIRKSVQKHGYRLKQGDLPWYMLLIDDSGGEVVDFRAVVMHGNHRVAVLAHLGWVSIPMAPPQTLLRNEVRLSDVANWPGVLDGSFSFDGARATFMSFFH